MIIATRIRALVRGAPGTAGEEPLARSGAFHTPRPIRSAQPGPPAVRSSRRPVPALDNKTKQDFEVVVSRCHEDVSWVETVRGDHATIYNQSSDEVPGHVSLPFAGGHAAVCVHHIVTSWHRLAQRTLFLHGSPFDHRLLKWEAYVLSPGPFVARLRERLKMDEPSLFGPWRTPDGKPHEILVPDKYAWWKDVIERVPSVEHRCPWGGQFAADKAVILRWGRDYWLRLLAIARSDGLVLATRKKYTAYEVGMMFEYTWPQILLGSEQGS
jgi:hypothetical protein